MTHHGSLFDPLNLFHLLNFHLPDLNLLNFHLLNMYTLDSYSLHGKNLNHGYCSNRFHGQKGLYRLNKGDSLHGATTAHVASVSWGNYHENQSQGHEIHDLLHKKYSSVKTTS